MLLSLGRSHNRTVRSSEQLIDSVRLVGCHSVLQTGCLCSRHVLRMARLLRSKAWIAPLSPPARIIRPSRRMVPECAMSSTPKRFIVFMALRVFEEKTCTREPVVTAKRSWAETVRLEGGGGGYEMCVTGDECCDGSSWSCELNDSQYRCSAVAVAGPLGSLIACSGWTSAAIVVVLSRYSSTKFGM